MSNGSNDLVETTIVWPDVIPRSVSIRGTFAQDCQNWWQETIPLSRTSAEGSDRYSVVMQLKPGRYEFKFVIDEVDWQINSDMYECTTDGSGNTNNVVTVALSASPSGH
ncbi:hypothetical protein LPJ66_004791, partial [Kickxella alabastrina]